MKVSPEHPIIYRMFHLIKNKSAQNTLKFNKILLESSNIVCSKLEGVFKVQLDLIQKVKTCKNLNIFFIKINFLNKKSKITEIKSIKKF